ncbi:MAG: hypothetical protein LBG72_03295, partial [Spirochaetaceae bacterium]|nr:hypothetical protein [Spirochaetaceae bacterium]
GSKPAELSSGATYQQAIDKLDAIIEYCNNNPGGTNDGYKSSAEYYRTMISGTNYQTNWSGYSSTVISQINSLITNLQ